MTPAQLVVAAAQVRFVLLKQHPNPDAATIKKFFLKRWPKIRHSEVIAICTYVAGLERKP